MMIAIYPSFSKGVDMLFSDIKESLKGIIIMLTVMLAQLIKTIKWIKNSLRIKKRKTL